MIGATWWQGCRELLLRDNCFCKAIAVSQAFIFHFKWYSILHFAVSQLLCWAFLSIVIAKLWDRFSFWIWISNRSCPLCATNSRLKIWSSKNIIILHKFLSTLLWKMSQKLIAAPVGTLPENITSIITEQANKSSERPSTRTQEDNRLNDDKIVVLWAT